MFRSHLTAFAAFVASFASSADSYAIHDVHKKDICGVWRLTSQRSFLPRVMDINKQKMNLPIKEFTVYPKKKKAVIEEEEILLMLRDDGTFIQYGGISSAENEAVEGGKGAQPKFGVIKKKKEDDEVDSVESIMGLGVSKGTWGFLDRKLILATDRPKKANVKNGHDTIFVGNLVVKSEESLSDNPVLQSTKNNTSSVTSEASSDFEERESESFDVHLSVPMGSVEIGKFMYPKNHPSFFDQPIFKPTPTGSFQLRQILGTLNTRTKGDKEPEEKFNPKDLYGKRYFLTSYPIQQKPRGKRRWSIKYNMYVVDPPRAESEEEKKRQASMPIPICTMEIELFSNMTFCTLAGFGSAKILRGRWSIIGHEKDQLWMQIWRFGFGRSTSGSTFSEGAGLTMDDEKAYWGRIVKLKSSQDDKENKDTTDLLEKKAQQVEVNGSVLDGLGLEPIPVARFTMIEITEDSLDEEDDESDNDEEEGTGSSIFFTDTSGDDTEDDIFSSPDSFQ